MDTKEKAAKKMLADIRKTVKRLKIKLTSMEFVRIKSPRHAPQCCALGAALALKAKTKNELKKLLGTNWHEGDHVAYCADRPALVAKILNGATTEEDMLQLESGFENWHLYDWIADNRGIETDENHPFYKIGAALRKDADKAKR